MFLKKLILRVSVALSFLLNIFLICQKPFQEENNNRWRLEHPLISQTIENNPTDDGTANILHYSDLKQQIEQLAGNYIQQKKVGIFIQDIRTGSWLGINEREEFIPASLFKIPIAMAILKKSERGEINISNMVDLDEADLNSESGLLYKEPVGTKIPYLQLLRAMIATSDNTAKNMLFKQISPEEIAAVFTHIGIPNPYGEPNRSTVSPRGYNRIFKSLYYSTYLSPEDSERILDLATDTTMEILLSSGVPPEIQISHKFGICPNCLHDCGIVYHPKNPYSICVMTKDLEVPEAKELIANISRLAYKFVNAH